MSGDRTFVRLGRGVGRRSRLFIFDLPEKRSFSTHRAAKPQNPSLRDEESRLKA
jgi:hypothetical protein